MNKVFLSFFLLLSFIAPVNAETVAIGAARITYKTPPGFVRADALFPLQLEEFDKEFGLRTVVFAKYVPAAHIKAHETDPEAVPDWYIHLAYDEKFSKFPLNRSGFVAVSALLNKGIAYEYTSDAFIRKLEDVFRHAIGRELTITGMTQKGFVEKKGMTRSMLATGHAVIKGEAGSTDLPIATMTTFVLSQRRFVTLLQIGRIGSEADLPAFTQQALERVPQILPSSAQTRNP
jgi:hypothetical protein